MSRRPLLLDLFCGAGGASMGYYQAGFDVIGVDIEPQPNYPFRFRQMGAFQFMRLLARRNRNNIMAIHASPPCQRYSALGTGTNANSEKFPDYVGVTRKWLEHIGLPYVIENVPNAPLVDPITLCGEMFTLRVIRHRLFESNVEIPALAHIPHRGPVGGYGHYKFQAEGYYFAPYGNGGGKGTIQQWRSAMGIPWMKTKDELSQAIPPAYTKYVGTHLIRSV